MINLSNYRLKINLAKCYNDQRKLSYIYIDTEKITKVIGLYQKIRDVFNIDKPFHLFTDENIFLPLSEDIRIIDKKDTITVLPESFHLNGNTYQPVSEKAQKNLTEPKKSENITFEANSSSQSESTTDTDNEPQVIVKKESKVKSNQKKCEEFVNSSNPSKRKRKRSRRGRKNQNQTSPQVNENSNKIHNQSSNNHNNDGNKSGNKSALIPKHLKFDWEGLTNQHDKINGNLSKHSHNTKPIVRSVESTDLSLLLGQKYLNSPTRYVSAKVKPSLLTSIDTKSNSQKQNDNHKVKKPDSPIKTSVDPNKENIDYAKVNPLDYPTYNSEVQVDDIIAFRTLKIGEDYSPTVSGYIIAKAISKDSDKNNYVFKILEGHDQMKTPNGKFSLPSDGENDNEDANLDKSALVTLNASHLVEPRLIYRVNLKST